MDGARETVHCNTPPTCPVVRSAGVEEHTGVESRALRRRRPPNRGISGERSESAACRVRRRSVVRARLWRGDSPSQVWQPPVGGAVAPGNVELDDCMRTSRSPTTEVDRAKSEFASVGRRRDHREEDNVVVTNGIEAGDAL